MQGFWELPSFCIFCSKNTQKQWGGPEKRSWDILKVSYDSLGALVKIVGCGVDRKTVKGNEVRG